MSEKYKIIKMILYRKKIPIDIQEMIVDNLVPEHQKKNIIFHYKNRPGIFKWESLFLGELRDSYQDKIYNNNCFNPGHTRWLEEIDDEERQILSGCCDKDILRYFVDYFNEVDFNDYIEIALEKKKMYEMNARDRYSFYKLYNDPSFKHRWSWGMIEMIDSHYENKKKILKEKFSNFIDELYNEIIFPNLTFNV